MYKFTTAILLYLLFTITSIAQTSLFENIGIEQGLSQGMIYDLLQDQNGFIWFTTKDGLNRYDGYNFKLFTHDSKNPYSISDNFCTSLLLDKKGRLWIGTEKNGLNLFDALTQKFYHIKIINKTLKDESNYGIGYIGEDKEGNIYVYLNSIYKFVTLKAIDKFPKTESFASEVKDESNLEKSKTSKVISSTTYFPYNIFLKLYPSFKEKYSDFILKHPIDNVLIDNNSRYWVFTGLKLYCLDKNQVTEIICENKCNPNFAFKLTDSSIVFATLYNLWKFKPLELLQQKCLTTKNVYIKSPSTMQFCNNILSDNYNNLWIGTSGYGAEKFNPIFKKFHTYLQGFTLGQICQHKNGKYFANANFRPTNHFYEIDTKKNQFVLTSTMIERGKMHTSMAIDKDGKFWILERNVFNSKVSLLKYSENYVLEKRYPIFIETNNEIIIQQMKFDDNGKIWINSYDGYIYCFDPNKETYHSYNYKHVLPEKTTKLVTNFLYFDEMSCLWICTESSLIKMKNYNATPSFSIYTKDDKVTNSLNNNNVSSCITDPTNNQYLWISTKGGGLNKLNKNTGDIVHFTTEQGLPNNVVYGILKDNDSNLWMSTNRGISKLNIGKMIFTNYNKSDGLQDNEFNTYSFAYGNNGDLLFGGVNGLTAFNPKELMVNNKKPFIKIVGLKVNNKEVNPFDKTGILQQAIEFVKNIEVAFDQNQIGLEMALMDLTNPTKNIFEYQLVGIDKEWVQSGTNHIANYAQLPSGNYTFIARGTANGEIWSEIIELKIKINPPFYRTWWAYLIYTICTISLIYYWYRTQLNKVRLQEQVIYKEKEAKQLVELDKMKTKFFSNISHEIRTPLTLILAPAEQLTKQNPKEILNQLIFRNAKRLLELINQILDISKIDAGQMKINKQEKELVNYFNNCIQNFTTIATSKNIDISITQNKQNVLGLIDDDKVNKIMNNLLSNAIKFTHNNGKIKIAVIYYTDNSAIHMLIQDTGIGIAADEIQTIFNRYYQANSNNTTMHQGTGIGLALVKELVELMNGQIKLESTLGVGSTFKIDLPIK